MCGIAGFAGLETIEPEDLSAMIDTLTHRGPDDSGVWYSEDRAVGFAHRRLSIIDLSPGGHQPMSNAARTVHIAFNGEIYNYREIRAELLREGHRFRSESDTEVILEAYARWGEEFVRRLTGQFALALYDSSNHRLYLARDRAGEKPLFLWQTGRRIVFASELKAILALPDAPRRIDPVALQTFLAWGYVPGPLCMLGGMSKLLPGTILRVDLATGATKSWRYWDLPSHAPDTADETALLEELDALLLAAVRRQLVSDVPIGILLSGGIDSSLVTAMAARSSERPVKTFTVSFTGYKNDEAPHALLVSQHFGTEHTVIEAEAASVSLLNELALQYDEPISDSSMVPTYLVSRMIRRHAKVALGGDGGDELFGGYRSYDMVARLARMQALVPRMLRTRLAAVARRMPVTTRGRNFALALGAEGFEALAHRDVFFSEEWRHRLLTREALADGQPERERLSLASGARTLLQAAQRIDFRSYMVDDILVKVDRASMLTSLEVRAPFLDPAVAEFAFGRVPDRLKVAGGEKKILLRRLAARLLPPALDLSRKQGFSIPLSSWFFGDWGVFMREVLREADASIFRREGIDEIFTGQARMGNQLPRLFALTMFELWRRAYRITL